MTGLAAAHAAATWFMVGLIWTVQVVHYPLFHQVGTSSFARFEAGHTKRIGTLLVAPAIGEIATAAALFAARRDLLSFASGAVLAAIWVMTAVVQGRLHGRLAPGYDEAIVSRLVSSNWWRTALWSVRGVLALALLVTV